MNERFGFSVNYYSLFISTSFTYIENKLNVDLIAESVIVDNTIYPWRTVDKLISFVVNKRLLYSKRRLSYLNSVSTNLLRKRSREVI